MARRFLIDPDRQPLEQADEGRRVGLADPTAALSHPQQEFAASSGQSVGTAAARGSARNTSWA